MLETACAYAVGARKRGKRPGIIIAGHWSRLGSDCCRWYRFAARQRFVIVVTRSSGKRFAALDGPLCGLKSESPDVRDVPKTGTWLLNERPQQGVLQSGSFGWLPAHEPVTVDRGYDNLTHSVVGIFGRRADCPTRSKFSV